MSDVTLIARELNRTNDSKYPREHILGHPRAQIFHEKVGPLLEVDIKEQDEIEGQEKYATRASARLKPAIELKAYSKAYGHVSTSHKPKPSAQLASARASIS